MFKLKDKTMVDTWQSYMISRCTRLPPWPAGLVPTVLPVQGDLIVWSGFTASCLPTWCNAKGLGDGAPQLNASCCCWWSHVTPLEECRQRSPSWTTFLQMPSLKGSARMSILALQSGKARLVSPESCWLEHSKSLGVLRSSACSTKASLWCSLHCDMSKSKPLQRGCNM